MRFLLATLVCVAVLATMVLSAPLPPPMPTLPSHVYVGDTTSDSFPPERLSHIFFDPSISTLGLEKGPKSKWLPNLDSVRPSTSHHDVEAAKGVDIILSRRMAPEKAADFEAGIRPDSMVAERSPNVADDFDDLAVDRPRSIWEWIKGFPDAIGRSWHHHMEEPVTIEDLEDHFGR